MLQLAQIQPLTGEILGQGLGARIVQHARDLLLEHSGPAELLLLSHAQQFLVGNAAPQEEGQARRQFEIADAMHRAGRVGGIDFVHEQEAGRNQNPFQRGFDAMLEVRVLAARRIQLHQRCDIRRVHRPAISLARQRGEDLGGAGGFLRFRRRTADENLAAAGRIARADHVVGTRDGDLHHVAQIEILLHARSRWHRKARRWSARGRHPPTHPWAVVRRGRSAWWACGPVVVLDHQVFVQRQLLAERGADGAQARLQRHLHFVAVIGVDLVLGLGAGIQIDLDRIGRVMRRIEFESAAAARIQRKIVAGPFVIGGDAEGILEQVLGHLVVGG